MKKFQTSLAAVIFAVSGLSAAPIAGAADEEHFGFGSGTGMGSGATFGNASFGTAALSPTFAPSSAPGGNSASFGSGFNQQSNYGSGPLSGGSGAGGSATGTGTGPGGGGSMSGAPILTSPFASTPSGM